jgi:DNA-binding protein YbaB
MSKSDPREQKQREAQQIQQSAHKNQQKAEQQEVAGRHKNDLLKSHKRADKGPRGQ